MAKQQFIITEQMIANATTYTPLTAKVAFAQAVAEDCISPEVMTVQKIQGDQTLTLPQMYKENTMMKQLLLMQYFLERYFHVQVFEKFSAKDYDVYAASHPMNQLERFKGNSELKNRVFDIIADFKEVKKYLDIEIYGALKVRNDGIERFLAGVTLLSSPENIKALTEELNRTANELSAKESVTRKNLQEVQSNAETRKFLAEENKA